MTNSRAKTIFRYVFPTILSSVSVFLYSIIDGIIVGRGIGSDALGAINIAFPYIMFFTAFAMLTIIGGLAVTAIRIGRGDKDGAQDAFMHSLFLTVITGVIFTVIGVVFTEKVAILLGARGEYIPLVRDYIFWYSVFLIPVSVCNTFTGAGRNDDAPVLVSITTFIATSLNILGDYIFVFPLKMGVKGAAIATGIAQTLAALILLPHFLGKKGILKIKPFKPDLSLVGKIFLRGAPECVSQFEAPMGIMLTNRILSESLGNAALNAYSVIGYVATFSVAIFIGTAEGIQPLLGRSYGEKNEKDLNYYFKSGLRISFIGSIVVSAVITLLWGRILGIFAVDEATRDCAVYAVLRYMPGFLFQSLLVIINSYLYSTTRTKEALIINILRSFVLDTVIIFAFPAIFGAQSIWYTFAAYEAVALVIAFFMLKYADRNGPIGSAEE